jgi:hypothetical protein
MYRLLGDCHEYFAGCHPHHGGMKTGGVHHYHFTSSGGHGVGHGGTALVVLVLAIAAGKLMQKLGWLK